MATRPTWLTREALIVVAFLLVFVTIVVIGHVVWGWGAVPV